MSKHIAIEDFAANMAGTSRVNYGADLKRTVAALRRFADLVEAQSVGLCSINIQGSCEPQDFTTNTLNIKFFDYNGTESA